MTQCQQTTVHSSPYLTRPHACGQSSLYRRAFERGGHPCRSYSPFLPDRIVSSPCGPLRSFSYASWGSSSPSFCRQVRRRVVSRIVCPIGDSTGNAVGVAFREGGFCSKLKAGREVILQSNSGGSRFSSVGWIRCRRHKESGTRCEGSELSKVECHDVAPTGHFLGGTALCG